MNIQNLMKRTASNSFRFIPAALGLVFALLAINAQAANDYFTTAAVNGGSYSWDDALWSTSASGPFNANWIADSYGEFAGSGSYTVTVNNPEANFGWQFISSTSGATLTINAAGSGSLQVDPATSTYSGLYAQGIYTGAGQSQVINAPITGTGAIAPMYSGTAATTYLYLYGNNTYSGGTVLRNTYLLYYFNNNNSFGTGPIVTGPSTSFQVLVTTGSSAITIANSFLAQCNPSSLHLLPGANAPLVWSGPWNIGSSGITR
jgi:hypothetical protein